MPLLSPTTAYVTDLLIIKLVTFKLHASRHLFRTNSLLGSNNIYNYTMQAKNLSPELQMKASILVINPNSIPRSVVLTFDS